MGVQGTEWSNGKKLMRIIQKGTQVTDPYHGWRYADAENKSIRRNVLICVLGSCSCAVVQVRFRLLLLFYPVNDL